MILKVNHIAELIALIISIFGYKKIKHTYLQWMVPYLFILLVAELVANYLVNIAQKPTTSIYLWVNALSIVFYNYCFYHLFEKKRIIQRVIIVSASALVLISIILFFFVANYVEYKNYIIITGGIFLSVFSCLYLYQQFMKEELEVLLIYQPEFWISAGVLLFYSGVCTIYALHPIIARNNLLIFGMKLHNFFAQTLSVFLYSCLSVAALLWKKKPLI